MDMTDVVTTVGGEPVTVRDVCVRLKSIGVFRNTIYQVIEDKVVAHKLKKLNIKHNMQELRAYFDKRRKDHGITDVHEMQNYCRWLGVTLMQWEDMIEKEFFKEKLKDYVIIPDEIAAFYKSHEDSFTVVSLSRIVKKNQKDAEQIAKLVQSGKEFSALAREYSIEESSRVLGGYLGGFKKGMISDAIWEQAMIAGAGSLIGPIAEQNYWVVYRVDAVRGGELNNELNRNIKDRLFREWLNKEVYKARA